MTIRATISAKDLGKFEREMMKALKDETQRQMQAFGRDAVQYLIQRSVHIKDLGQFGRSWRSRSGPTHCDVYNMSPHGPFVEGGRQPGAKPPPAYALRDWVVRHLGDPKLVYAVAKKIGRDGIAPRRVLTMPENQVTLEDMLADRLNKWLDDVLKRSAKAR